MDYQQAVVASVRLGVDPDVAAAAVANIRAGTVTLLGVSGWIASGKDYIAPLVMVAAGRTDCRHMYYSAPLKDEMDQILSVVSSARDLASVGGCVTTVAQRMEVPVSQAAYVVGLLWSSTRDANHGLTAYSRTEAVRTALQFWGTEVRRRQDVDYWVKKALKPTIEVLADGASVYFTDVRFPNEAIGLQAVGGLVSRLEITRETQRQRLLSRDGIKPTEEQLYHESETALNAYAGFDVIVDNNGEAATTIEQIVAALSDRTLALAS